MKNPLCEHEEALRQWLQRSVESAGSVNIAGIAGAALGTDLGISRKENQDRAVIALFQYDCRPYLLGLVSDGMGGMKNGADCATRALSSFIVHFYSSLRSAATVPASLKEAALAANLSVHERYQGRGGATISAVAVTQEGASGVNVGDSRIYGRIGSRYEQLSIDDTLAGQLGKQGSEFSDRGLLQYIGSGDELEPHIIDIPSDLGHLLLTTDGVHYLPSATFNLVATSSENSLFAVRRLIAISKWLGGKDNSTLVSLPARLEDSISPSGGLISVFDSFGQLALSPPLEYAVGSSVASSGQDILESRRSPRSIRKAASPVSKKAGRKRKARPKKERGAASSSNEDRPVLHIDLFKNDGGGEK